MREEIMFDNRSKPCKCSVYNQHSKAESKTNSNPSKPKFGSSWGSQIVRGFTADKKAKQHLTAVPAKKPPLACSENSAQNNLSRVKRSLIGEFPSNTAQVHPQHGFDCNYIKSPSSHNLVLELDQLRELLRESKERELALRCELLQYKESPRVSELELELDIKKNEIEKLNSTVDSLEAEKTNLCEQLASLSSNHEESLISDSGSERNASSYKNLEIKVVELRRLNKELQLQKRNLAFRLSSAESKLARFAKDSEV